MAIPIIEVEEKIIAYLLHNPTEIYKYKKEYFSFEIFRFVFDYVQNSKNTKDLDLLYIYLSENNIDVSIDDLNTLMCKYDTFYDMKDYLDIIKNNYLYRCFKEKKEELNNISFENFQPEEVSNKINDISNIFYENTDLELLDSDGLVDLHLNTIDNRQQGELKRSLGFDVFNSIINKPGASGEMTGVVGQKGSAKSGMIKCIEQNLLNKDICVLSLNLEMSVDSCNDRRASINSGYILNDFLKFDKDNPRKVEKIKRSIEEMRSYKNYLFSDDAEISIQKLDSLIIKAKREFKRKGVLSDDGYVVVTIDTVDLMTDFEEAENSYRIKRAINDLHRICKKHGSHFILALQANENKLRSGKMFKKPEDLDYYKVGLEDIEGSASFAQRCRVVMTLTRPVQMKKRFFPDDMDLWNLETDFINCNIVKQNDGPEGFLKFVFNKNFRIQPFKD